MRMIVCQLQDAENLRPLMDDFLDRSLLTDASLLFAPSQIALAGVVYAVNKAQFDCNEYLNVKSSHVFFSDLVNYAKIHLVS